jgi:uncharacterized protein DUF6496
MAAKRKSTRRRYPKAASKKVAAAMHERKRGKLRSGRSGKKVTSRKQAIAIGLSQARRSGAKVPRKGTSGSSRRGGRRKGARKGRAAS